MDNEIVLHVGFRKSDGTVWRDAGVDSPVDVTLSASNLKHVSDEKFDAAVDAMAREGKLEPLKDGY
jgi:hypothetical protein